MKTSRKINNGESILELLLAVAVFSLIIPTVLYVVGTTADRQAARNWYYESLIMLEDVKDVVRHKKTTDWSMLSQDAMFKVSRGATGWEFVQISEATPPTPQDDLVATVKSEQIERDLSGKMVENGGYTDPATRKITITIDWYGAVNQTISSFIITRTDSLRSLDIKEKNDIEDGGVFDGLTILAGTPPAAGASLVFGGGVPGPLSGVMSHWTMDGETESIKSEIDLAEGGTDNLFFEGLPKYKDSLFGKAITTSEVSDRLYASPSARLDLTGSAAFVVWLKSQEDPQNPQTILDKYDSNTGYLMRILPGGQVEMTLGGGTSFITAKTQKNILDGLWHIIGFSYNNNELIPYFDGVQNGEITSGPASLFPSSTIISVGNDNGPANSPFAGQIDDVQLYAGALSDKDFENLSFATYETKAFDLGQSSLVHGFSAHITKPEGAKIEFQVSVTNKVSAVCEKPSLYLGPKNQEESVYEVSEVGETSVSYPFPMGSFSGGNYSNPGECVSIKAKVFWNKDTGTSPSLSDIKVLYSL